VPVRDPEGSEETEFLEDPIRGIEGDGGAGCFVTVERERGDDELPWKRPSLQGVGAEASEGIEAKRTWPRRCGGASANAPPVSRSAISVGSASAYPRRRRPGVAHPEAVTRSATNRVMAWVGSFD
jgi:hypothetical protein